MSFRFHLIQSSLLIVFGLNILGDLAVICGKDRLDHEPSITSSVQASKEHITSNSTSAKEEATGFAGHCSNFCHLGGCHFDHCSYLITTTIDSAFQELLFFSYNFGALLNLKSPILEGPKRPPRIS